MPNRDLKESNRRSPSLQLLSDAAERLWTRLITAVDDFGRMEADPEVVFTSCFQRVPRGWTIDKVARCITELSTLAAAGQTPMIQLYQAGPKRYLQIISAESHIYRRAKESKYPNPPVNSPQPPADARICAQIPSISELRTPILEIPNPEPRTSGGRVSGGQAVGSVESFELTPELEAWAAKQGIAHPEQYVEEFKDYWRTTQGKRKNGQTVKDWDAAFRNRLRSLKDTGKLKTNVWA